MSGPRAVGWAMVAVQAILLATLALLPAPDRSTAWWVEALAWGAIVGGLVVVVLAARSLGDALTPTPEPRAGVALQRSGIYRHVRHPIYSGVLLITIGLVLRNRGLPAVVVGLVTMLFFGAKARWEERRLLRRHPDYGAYAHTTPRFVPTPWRRR